MVACQHQMEMSARQPAIGYTRVIVSLSYPTIVPNFVIAKTIINHKPFVYIFLYNINSFHSLQSPSWKNEVVTAQVPFAPLLLLFWHGMMVPSLIVFQRRFALPWFCLERQRWREYPSQMEQFVLCFHVFRTAVESTDRRCRKIQNSSSDHILISYLIDV